MISGLKRLKGLWFKASRFQGFKEFKACGLRV